MKVLEDQRTLILVGKWNKYIFSPEWIAKKLFRTEDVNLSIPMQLDAPYKYAHPNKPIEILPAEDKIVFNCLQYKDEYLNEIETMAITLGNLLPHTPLLAFGVNFKYSEEDKLIGLARNWLI